MSYIFICFCMYLCIWRYLCMNKQITTEEIARRAGVSRGTVDRVLHNRGNVSPDSRAAVEAVLKQVDYKFNLHTSAVSLKKRYRIVVTIPYAVEGEYWGLIKKGIENAANVYFDFKLDIRFCLFDQFTAESCESAFSELLSLNPDGVVIGPVFVDYTVVLCRQLDRLKTPYVFVDSFIDGTNPLTSYSVDQITCGRLIGRLLLFLIPAGKSIAVMDIERKGNSNKDNFSSREDGLLSFIRERNPSMKVYQSTFSSRIEEGEKQVMDFLKGHPEVKGIAVLNSRGYLIADILKRNRISDVRVISMDTTDDNVRCMKDESISVLVCQKPQLQSFHAVRAIIEYLLYKNNNTPHIHYLPVDIAFPENLKYNQEADSAEYKETLMFESTSSI